jgi:perosamine synthetase
MSSRHSVQISQPSIGEDEWLAVREPLMSGWLTQGPKVDAFEKAFAVRHAVSHAVATTSCTTALHLILAALGIGPGDQVIVPAFTWIATANVVAYCGAEPVFVDIEPTTFNMDVAKVSRKITERTKAIIPVHLFGLCADMDALARIAPGIPMIEDAACASGSTYKGRPAGSLGAAAAFSFHPRKIITTGEGGMITTNDGPLAKKLRILRNHGASVSEEERHRGPRPYLLPEFDVLGFNYRMTDLQGAVGLVQLSKLEAFIHERVTWAGYYSNELSGVSWLHPPSTPDGYGPNWQSYVCLVKSDTVPMTRNSIMEELQAKGISTRPGTHAIHTLSYYKQKFGIKPEDYPVALSSDRSTIALPLHNRMSPEDYAFVVQAIREIG